MANEVIKVYDTEANAIANGTSGRIDPVTAISGHSGIIANVADEYSALSGYEDLAYYIYKKFYYRIEANEPVTEFHIDWDDGEDNSPEKANIEIIKLTTPSISTITSHIFTEHKHFFPLIRVKNMEGFLSKWYTNDSSLNSYSNLEKNTLTAGQNEFSVVSEEKADSDRIMSFLAAYLPPIGVLKADKKRIYSGIDNDAILNSFNYPLLYAFSSSSASTKPNIKFTLQDNNGAIREHTLDSTSSSKLISATSSWESQGNSGDLALRAVPKGNYTQNEVQSVQRIEVNAFVSGGVPPAWDIAWSATNDVYIDLHYESSATGDVNGNYHCRLFFVASGTGGDSEEGGPVGATIPDGYSSIKINVTSSTLTAANVNQYIRTALEANNDASGLKLPFDVGSAGGSSDYYADYTIHGEGAVTAWGESTAGNEEIDCSVQTAGAGVSTTTTYIKKLLRVELDNATELADTDRVFINVWDAGSGLATDPDEAVDKTVAVLSNGNPIVEIEDSNTAFLDGTESFTRASNLSISTYNFDNDKLLKKGAIQATDSDAASDLMSGTFSSIGTKELSFSFDRIGNSLDSDSRFYSTYRLLRLQVKDNMVDATSPVVVGDGIDTLTYSTIEHFDDTSYTAAAVKMPSDLASRGLLLYSNRNTDKTATWRDISTRNSIDNQEIFGDATGSSDGAYMLMDTSDITDHPRNHLFIAQTEKFDRLFFRMNNNSNITDTMPTVAITAYYANGTTWEPLEIIDETQGFKTSGSIKFNMPHDWKKGDYEDVDSGDWDGPVEQHGNESGTAPSDLWTFNAYAVLISINVLDSNSRNRLIKCMNLWPYNNSHSQLIKLEDPHHVSLNNIAIAQSISFGRNSKVISVEDKFGKADIRKIGAGGGSVRFGGIDLGSTDDDRKTIVGYQKNATPVFLDVTHKSDEKTRFYGVLSKVTEDHPAGKMVPKWAVTMNISHVLDLSSTGAIASDKIPIGGALVDDGKYLL